MVKRVLEVRQGLTGAWFVTELDERDGEYVNGSATQINADPKKDVAVEMARQELASRLGAFDEFRVKAADGAILYVESVS